MRRDREKPLTASNSSPKIFIVWLIFRARIHYWRKSTKMFEIQPHRFFRTFLKYEIDFCERMRSDRDRRSTVSGFSVRNNFSSNCCLLQIRHFEIFIKSYLLVLFLIVEQAINQNNDVLEKNGQRHRIQREKYF